MMEFSRRSFFGTSTAFAVWSLMGRGASGAEAGEPLIRFGVVSDIHITHNGKDGDGYRGGTSNTFRKALKFFGERKADAVMIAGDMADHGLLNQLLVVGDEWRAAFPGNRRPDGQPIEKFFVYGNHDMFRRKGDNPQNIGARPAECWKQAFDEEWTPINCKVIKGFTFIGAHWGREKELAAFIAANEQKLGLKGTKPFFYTQHPHPYRTTYTEWLPYAWDNDRDGKTVTATLKRYPNAVAFSGHSHEPLNNPKTVWQDGFTSIGTSSLMYVDEPINCDNSHRGQPKSTRMAKVNDKSRQGWFVSVYADRMVLERWELEMGEKLGPDRIVSLPAGQGGWQYQFEKQAMASKAPEFPVGAKAKAEVFDRDLGNGKKEKCVRVTFPSAVSVDPNYQVWCYDIAARNAGWDLQKRRIIAPGYLYPESRGPKTAECIFALADLGGSLDGVVFEVVPLNAFWKGGRPIASI